MGNYILIKPDPPITKLGDFHVEISYEPEKYNSVTGVVISTCELTFKKKLKGKSDRVQEKNMNPIEWNCEMEVQEGDRVYFRHIHNLDNKEAVFINGERYLLIPYRSLICRADLYPLNGYTIIRRNLKDGEVEGNIGEVVSDGCVKEYFHFDRKERKFESGTKVLFMGGRPMQHFLFSDGVPLVYVHKKDIIGEL